MPYPQILSPAEAAAALTQQRVNECIDAHKNFRLEAGAGAGKTYSLVEALKRLIAERGGHYMQRSQRVACITYTNVARDEILNEIDQHPAILVETIHAFCWAAMARFQPKLRKFIPELNHADKLAEIDGDLGQRAVEYDLGFFGIEDDKVTLSHDDIPKLMALLMELPKFRVMLSADFPIIFIDEYQDTDPNFMGAISKHFFQDGPGPLVGLFGDHWQTIYRDDFDLSKFDGVEPINKGANFRSVPAVVDVLNKLRPELVQEVRDPEAIGTAQAFHTNAIPGERTDTPHSKGDVMPPVAKACLEKVRDTLSAEGWDFAPQTTKVLMLTHSALATEQGYPMIEEIFKGRTDAYVKREDKAIEFLSTVIEPMRQAYADKRFGDMFQVLGRTRPLQSHTDKQRWREDMSVLESLRIHGTIGQVIDHLKATHRPPLPDAILAREKAIAEFGLETGEPESGSQHRYRRLRDVPYGELVELTKFADGFTPFATQHSVKGAEFENVLVVLGGGWNHYNWPRMLSYLGTKVPKQHEKGFYRARNLFYVSVSRPKKRLAVLLTQTLSLEALDSLSNLFGADKVHALTL